jgi:hypothetical protein
MNENKIKFIRNDYPNRYEVYFFEIIFKYLDLKKNIFTSLNNKNIMIIKGKIIDQINEMEKKIEKKKFLFSYNYINKNCNSSSSINTANNNNLDFFIFKPIMLMKFWDNSTEDNYLQSYNELNKFFLVKTYLKTKDPIKAFDEVKIVLDNENVFINSHLLLFYFGKIIKELILIVDKISDNKILDLLDKYKVDNYNKIKRILREFGQPNSVNYKKRAKNYENLSMISEYFEIDKKK